MVRSRDVQIRVEILERKRVFNTWALKVGRNAEVQKESLQKLH